MLTRNYLRLREWSRGQTMTEYALILSAVAIVVFVGYQTMGQTIKQLITNVDAQI
ncbi:MAG TPA: Flp family type IVb pilin [Candidatus Binataceae bacterium]|nr:Flp family type IVb pilin [Candidatus Binataceae bacterium]